MKKLLILSALLLSLFQTKTAEDCSSITLSNYKTCIPQRWNAFKDKLKPSTPTFQEKLEAAAKSGKQSAREFFCKTAQPKLETGEQRACSFVCNLGRFSKYLPSLIGKNNAKQAADRCFCQCVLTNNPRAAEALANLKAEL